MSGEGVVERGEAFLAVLRQEEADELRTLARLAAWTSGEIEVAVAAARGQGATWEDIAQRLDIKLQTAWQRYRVPEQAVPAVKRYQCPYCSTAGTYRHNLRKHLMGLTRFGGHELKREDADAVIASVEPDRIT